MIICNINTLCQDLSPLLSIIGNIILILKMLVPILLIIIGTFDIAKSIVSKKPEETKKNMLNFFKRLAIAMIIFFIPLIFSILFNFVGEFINIKENSGLDYDICYDCIFNPENGTCNKINRIKRG